MRKRHLSPIAFVLMVLLSFQSFTPMVYGDDETGVYDLLGNKKVVVTQNDEEIAEGGTIDAKKDIKIVYSFDVPVIGDDPTPDEYVQGGDTATFDLPNELTLANSDTQDLEDESGVVIGEVNFSGNQAIVTFNNKLDDMTISEVSAEVEAEMTYDTSATPEEGESYTITILGKTFTVVVPPKQVTISGEKTGIIDITNKIVDWKVEVTATVEGGGEGKLKEYSFSDDLSEVGTYVADSFKIAESEDGTGASGIDSGYDEATKTLSYSFPDDAKGTYYLFFQTEITDSLIYTTDAQSISNTAEIYKDGEVKATLAGLVSFQMEWIEKNGVVAIGTEENPDGSYKSTGREIQWTIQANQMGATIDNAVITDTLPDGLSYESASIAYRNIGDTDWLPDPPTAIVPDSVGQELTFNLGNALSGKECLITLITKVDDTDPAFEIKVFHNSATLTGDNLPAGGFESNSKSVNIGFNPISKSAGSYNKTTHKMNWSVTVNTRNQLYSDHLRVIDLLVYGDVNSFDASDFSNLDTGSTLTDIKYDDLQKLTPRYNQKYDGNFSTTDGLDITVHHLVKDGKNVADVLIITQSGGIGFDHTKSNSFSYDTLVTNPDIYASNATSTIYNTATLFSDILMLNSATASMSVTSNMLKKDMMTRENALAFEADTENLIAVNSSASGATGSFRYDDKSVIYRIHVNTNGLTDATNDVTTVDGEILGNIEVTDTLPKGWEFKPLDGKDFFIFEKSGTSAVAPEIGDYSAFLSTSGITAATADAGESMSFEFSQLTKPYVILVKAGPTEETAAGYFAENKSYNLVNNVAMANTHYSSNKVPKTSVTTTVTSQVLDKTYTIPETGTLLWTVDYKPYDIIHEGAYIEDVLPSGLDLRMDAQGNLVLTDNIKIVKLNMAANGSYSVGDEVILAADQNSITYNNATRTLRFDLPDTQQAYRLTYKTDITGNPGTIMINSVSLCATHAANEESSKSYLISSTDASATFTRGGWIRITKIDQASNPLAGAEFTLFAEDGVTAIKKGISGSNGIVQLKAITPGNYILKEMEAPAGYNVPTQTYTVSVVNNGGTIATSINNTGLNSVTVRNTLIGTVGELKINKTVTGNAGDTTKEFDFTLTFTGTGNTEFPYTKTDSPDGVIKSGDTIKLIHGQEITIMCIPKDTAYTVTESESSAQGYKVVKSGDTGIIIADATQTASFINSKKKKDSDVVPGTKGSVEIIKVDGENSSKALAGAAFELLDNNKNVIEASEKTGKDGVASFDKLEFNKEYFIREKSAPEGYKLSDKVYSFQLSDDDGGRNITIEFKNDKLAEETKPVDPVTPVTPEVPEEPQEPQVPKDPEDSTTTGINDGDVPKGSVKKEDEDYLNIGPDGIPTGGMFIGDPRPGSNELDDTPKTGVGFAAKKVAIALSILSGCGLILIGILKKRKFKV